MAVIQPAWGATALVQRRTDPPVAVSGNPRQNTLAALTIVKQPSLRHGHTCRVTMRNASAFEVQEASSGQIRQMAGSAASARSSILAHEEARAHRP